MTEPIDTEWTDAPVCPHCGHEHRDWWEWLDDEDGEHDCDNCGRVFRWSQYIRIKFSTRLEAQ